MGRPSCSYLLTHSSGFAHDAANPDLTKWAVASGRTENCMTHSLKGFYCSLEVPARRRLGLWRRNRLGRSHCLDYFRPLIRGLHGGAYPEASWDVVNSLPSAQAARSYALNPGDVPRSDKKGSLMWGGMVNTHWVRSSNCLEYEKWSTDQ
jgi:hypothetical protein